MEWSTGIVRAMNQIADLLRRFVGKNVTLSRHGFLDDNQPEPARVEKALLAYLVDRRDSPRVRLQVLVTEADGGTKLDPIDIEPGCTVTVGDDLFVIEYVAGAYIVVGLAE